MGDREAIKAEMQRQVRQWCGFGCVICGCPLYIYEHMVEYAENPVHERENLTLLCPLHELEKTKGLLSRTDVQAANREPFNRSRGVTDPYGLHFSGGRCEMLLGGNRFLSEGRRLVPMLVNNQEPIAFDFNNDGHLELNASIPDRSGEVALLIVANEIVLATTAWDITFIGTRLTLRHGPGDFQFEASFQVPDRIDITRLDMRYGDTHVWVDPQGLHVRGPGPRTRDLNGTTMAGGFEHAIALDSRILRPPGIHL
ncbi:hypothetical protein [Streptacidiphilus melanogenes]|uniref:hypothetical protein n=1 Tax=Streptacidiphilus melanogenes TaxID=411235 RepID=UPI00126A1F20|nr:hypothetical protein [Streptacidiphilus melanogenes]